MNRIPPKTERDVLSGTAAAGGLFWLVCLFGHGCASSPSLPDSRPPAALITRSQFGAEWPFTVESGRLGCADGLVTFTTSDGRTVVVNNDESPNDVSRQHGWKTLKASGLWQKQRNLPSFYTSITAVLRRGKEHCP